MKIKNLLYLTPIFFVLALCLLGFRFVVPLSDSMEPTIPRGSLVVTTPTWIRNPKVNDTILFEVKIGNHSFHVLHRVVGLSNEGFYTKGDNRCFRDPWVARDVVGVAVLCIPMLGYVMLVLKPVLMLVLIGLGIFHLAYWLLKGEGDEGRG